MRGHVAGVRDSDTARGDMLAILIPSIWLVVVTLFVAVCRSAAHGDDVLGQTSAASTLDAATQERMPALRGGPAPSSPAARWNGRGDAYPSVSPRLAVRRRPRRGVAHPGQALRPH